MLSPEQCQQLRDALIDAFPDKSGFEEMLYYGLKKNLNEIARDNSLKIIVLDLIRTAEAQGWFLQLVDAARKSNPGNSRLQAIAQELLISAPTVSLSNISLEPSNQQQKILILAAVPNRLRLDEEIRKIEGAIKRAVKRDLFDIRIKTAVRPRDIRRAIREERPSIVHFCGHGMEDGSLVLEDDMGKHKPVLPQALTALFKLHTDYVKCVVINACHSSELASSISQHINYVIGMNQQIDDRAAVAFAEGFYDGLGYDNIDNQDVIERAFEEAMVAIQLENLLQNSVPVLCGNGIIQRNPKPIENFKKSFSLPSTPKKPVIAPKQENIKNLTNQMPITVVRQKTPSLPQPLSEKDIIVYIEKLPKGNSYPVYQVFGVICSFYEHGIATPAEILLLCLPEYSKQAVQKVIDGALNNELKNLITIIAKGRFERIGISANVNLQKASQIFSPKSIEKYLTYSIPTLNATQDIHQRWISHCLRGLATNGKENLVLKLLKDYPTIQAFKPQKDDSPEWSIWIKTYEALQQKHPEDRVIRRQYLGLVIKNGSQQQKNDALAQTSTWLKSNYLKFYNAISQDTLLRNELIPLLQKFISLALDNYLKNKYVYQALFNIFKHFREYLNQNTYKSLTSFIAQHTLDIPVQYWEEIINAANIVRDFDNGLHQAEKTYLNVLIAVKKKQKSGANIQTLNRITQYVHLHYARFIIQEGSSRIDKAIEYLRYVIKDNPKHGLAHLYMAQCYQLKGVNFYSEVRKYYQRAIDLDNQQTGYFWYEFGCYYRHIAKNAAQARNCFEESLKQKKNLGACVELADLEVGNKNFSRAKQLLQQGRSVKGITRRDIQQWSQLERRIQNLEKLLP
jgi:Effector-associated domain 1/CHAT domain